VGGCVPCRGGACSHYPQEAPSPGSLGSFILTEINAPLLRRAGVLSALHRARLGVSAYHPRRSFARWMEEAGILETHQHADVGYGPGRFTGDTALRLAHLFGTSAQLWPNLQSLYDLRLAQEKVGKSIKAFPTLKRRELAHA